MEKHKQTDSPYAHRRAQLLAQLPANSMVVLAAAPEVYRNADMPYLYRANSDFYYLTGVKEPDAWLVLVPGRVDGEALLFNRVRDPLKELWDGKLLGQEAAVSEYGFDQAFPMADLETELAKLLVGIKDVYFALGDPAVSPVLDQQIADLRSKARQGYQVPAVYRDVQVLLHRMRQVKDASEQAKLKRSAEIAAAAHKRAMQAVKPGMNECELEAELLHECVRQGARVPAYTPIVAGGANACILHYIENNQTLQDGDLVLIDAGGEFEMYASDITRTFPVNGKFSTCQKQLYEAVLKAQLAVIDAVKPGVLFGSLQDLAVRELTQGLLTLGLLRGELETLIDDKAYQAFYMHRVSHWLGLDTHDVGDYKIDGECRALEPGMVLTVEPGLYVAPDEATVAEQWRGIGIRIEDDVLVTETGCDVLSADVPKTVAAIEALMAS